MKIEEIRKSRTPADHGLRTTDYGRVIFLILRFVFPTAAHVPEQHRRTLIKTESIP